VARVARATGLNVVHGTGVYVEPSHPDWVQSASVEDLADLFISEVRVGIGDTGVRAGIIGEIGTSGVAKASRDYRRVGDITAEEEKVLRAAGRASVATGAAVGVHLDVRGHGAHRIIDILEEEGVDPSRMIMDHMDPVADFDYHLAVAARGVFVEYDQFGRDYYADEIGVSWGHDTLRLEYVRAMIEAGYEDQLLLSHDVCLKMDLRAYGGNGYDHIFTSVVPTMKRKGITGQQIEKLFIENPKRALAFDVDAQLQLGEMVQQPAAGTR
jgi:phosphotriesterase-related protein